MSVFTRSRLVLAASLGAGLFGILAACAENDDVTTAGPDASISLPDPSADAAGDGGGLDVEEPPDPCLPNTLCPVANIFAPTGSIDTRTRIAALRGRSANDIWAVGALGVVLHYDGSAWTQVSLGAKESLAAIWLGVSSEVAISTLTSLYAHDLTAPDAGDAGASDGGWTHVTDPTADDVVGTSTGRVTSAWATPTSTWAWITTQEYSTAILGFPVVNGLWRMRIVAKAPMIDVRSPFPDAICATFECTLLSAIHGATPDDLWAVGLSGTVVHVQNAQAATPTLEAFDSATRASLNGVWAAATNDVWMVGGQGAVRRYSGQPHVLDVVPGVPATESLHAVSGTSSTDVWAVGDESTVLHYDGTSWSRVPVTGLSGRGGRKPALFAIYTATPGHVWIAGDGILLSIGGLP